MTDDTFSEKSSMPEFKKVKRIQLRIRIKENLYHSKGWTMRLLAEKLGVDYQTVLFWNRGETHPKLSSLVQLARLLQCPLDELVE